MVEISTDAYFTGKAGKNNIDSTGEAKVVEPVDALTDLLR